MGKMQGVRSEGNISTKWLWIGLGGALDWVSQIFHTDSVPMPKLLPDNFVYDLFVRHTFFDVFDPAFEDEKRSGHRVRSMSLPSTPVVRNDDGEVKADPIEPCELAVAVLDQPQERTRRKRGKRGQGRGKFAADKSVQVVGVLVSLALAKTLQTLRLLVRSTPLQTALLALPAVSPTECARVTAGRVIVTPWT